ncbi:MAG: chemotaxis protein CheX [Oligoflexia bacterium]|nr:chemotaxis protein CheX [Oligoflexia bacterium]MBF0366050.1 chemotaxis protein CheX [Oligoflexia bacterium]
MGAQRFIEFSRPFVQASKVIFETMIATKIEAGKPSIKKDQRPRGDISAVIGLTGMYEGKEGDGPIRGMMVISWPMSTYVKIANAMLMESFTEYSDAISDTGAEISNMILGNAKRDLKALGYSLDMTIPSTISGQGHTISYPIDTTVVLIPIISAHGEFYMELCFKF